MANIIVKPMRGKGNGVVSVTLPKNELPEVQNIGLVVHGCDGMYNKPVRIVQGAGNVITIKDFDYLVINYCWDDSSGKDFDSATAFVNSGLVYGGESIDGKYVGWSRSDLNTGLMSNTVPNVGPSPYYIEWAGDNQTSGKECVKIDMRTLMQNKDALPDITTIAVKGNWFEDLGNGRVCVKMVAYKGGTMVKDSANFTFNNQGGTIVYEGKKGGVVLSRGKTNYQNINSFYADICTVSYDKTTGDGTIILKSSPDNTICNSSSCV